MRVSILSVCSSSIPMARPATSMAMSQFADSAREAIRHDLMDWLTGQGCVWHREDPEGAN